MTVDRLLTLIAIIWFVTALLYLAVIGIIHVEAAEDPGGADTEMVCGTWTWYADGVMERVRETRGLTPCGECVGMAATVSQEHLGRHVDIWYRGEWRGMFQVVDVGDGRNRPGLVGEIGIEMARVWGVRKPWWGCYRAG